MAADTPIPKVGTIVRGRVVRFLEHGALVKIGNGQKGFIPNSQVSWLNKRAKANEVLKLREEIDVAVLGVWRARTSGVYISLSLLQVTENPWETVEAQHPVGSRASAKVVKFLPSGAIAELSTGFHAFVHNSEISWTEQKAYAQDFLRIGDEINVVIQSVDKANQQINTSFRHAIENPWTTLLVVYPIGTMTTGRVVCVREYGVFVMLANGCTGLLHKSQFSPGVPAIELGDSVQVRILAYDQEKHRIAFGWSASMS